MELWYVQNGQVIMTIPTLGRCHIFWCVKRPSTLFLRNLKVTFSHHYFAYQVEPLKDFVLLCDLAIHQVFHKYCIESSFMLSNPVTMLNFLFILVLYASKSIMHNVMYYCILL